MDGPQPPRDKADRGSTMIAAAIVAASLIVYWGLPETPRYQLASSGSAIVRMNNDSGEMVACDLQRCKRITPPDRTKTISLFGGNAKKAPPALPTPAPAEESK